MSKRIKLYLRLIDAKQADDMDNWLEFLGSWH